MKKLLATTAVALIATAGVASAQSVLERVLGQIDNATNLASVNGTFANIAENIGGGGELQYVLDDGSVLTAVEWAAYEGEATLVDVLQSDGNGIDGSITNVINGVSEVAAATQESIANETTMAIEWNLPTLDIGDLSTTALGAVNTGDITLGVNSAVDEASTTSTHAVSALIEQLGGSTDAGALVLNVASNMTGVNGSISNTMTDVNGSINSAATTALGAVNTGTIVSGVDAAVTGIVGSGTTAGQ